MRTIDRNSFILLTIIGAIYFSFTFSESKIKETDSKSFNKLSEFEKKIILYKGTELPFSGKYNYHSEEGTYQCKQCNQNLYTSNHKFNSNCGWPSFDDEIDNAILFIPDLDGIRTEILCSNCNGHLGHYFLGENYTKKNVRHCVNSTSLIFKKSIDMNNIKQAYYAGGCFWGVEYLFEKLEGVISAESGYMGGTVKNPTYQQVCYENTGHLEAVKVEYDSSKINFESLTKYFFEIHDPTQKNGQGPDIGSQYLSAIFFNDVEEKKISLELIEILKEKGYDISTKLYECDTFWLAEDYHQNYYKKKSGTPYCHFYTKRF